MTDTAASTTTDAPPRMAPRRCVRVRSSHAAGAQHTRTAATRTRKRGAQEVTTADAADTVHTAFPATNFPPPNHHGGVAAPAAPTAPSSIASRSHPAASRPPRVDDDEDSEDDDDDVAILDDTLAAHPLSLVAYAAAARAAIAGDDALPPDEVVREAASLLGQGDADRIADIMRCWQAATRDLGMEIALHDAKPMHSEAVGECINLAASLAVGMQGGGGGGGVGSIMPGGVGGGARGGGTHEYGHMASAIAGIVSNAEALAPHPALPRDSQPRPAPLPQPPHLCAKGPTLPPGAVEDLLDPPSGWPSAPSGAPSGLDTKIKMSGHAHTDTPAPPRVGATAGGGGNAAAAGGGGSATSGDAIHQGGAQHHHAPPSLTPFSSAHVFRVVSENFVSSLGTLSFQCCSPLHVAAFCGHTSVVESFVASMPSLVTSANSHGCTPLHFAAHQGHAGIVARLAACSDCMVCGRVYTGGGVYRVGMYTGGGKEINTSTCIHTHTHTTG